MSTARKTRHVPDVRGVGDPLVRKALEVLKENHDLLTGRTQPPLAALASTATTAEIIAAINALTERLQQ